jgi:hypothetical protein
MTGLRRRVVAASALVLALAGMPMLAGCGANPVESIVKQATGGKVDVGGTTVPSDFPKRIPLEKGSVVSSVGIGSGTKKSWNVSIRVTGGDPSGAIRAALKKAGFRIEIDSGSVAADSGAFLADDADYGVAIGVTKDGKGYIVNYTVTPVSSSN